MHNDKRREVIEQTIAQAIEAVQQWSDSFKRMNETMRAAEARAHSESQPSPAQESARAFEQVMQEAFKIAQQWADAFQDSADDDSNVSQEQTASAAPSNQQNQPSVPDTADDTATQARLAAIEARLAAIEMRLARLEQQ